MIEIRIFKTADQLVSEAAELLCETLSTPGNLMLSGGSTPYVIYNRIAAASGPVHPGRSLFLSDERMVPPDSPDNNAGNLIPMLQSLQCEDRFIRVETSLPAEEAANRFSRNLESINPIDLGLLGMGSDGHTAGLFTVDQAGLKTGPLALHADRPDGMQGVSVTPAVFQRIERIILLVTGESKRGIISTLQTDPGSIPAGIALSGHPAVELWTDIDLGAAG